MKRRSTLPLTILLGAAFALVAIRLFDIQFATGDVFPEYSSLRSDPQGSKLLFDGLAGIKAVQVERNFLPLEYLPGGGASILVLGVDPEKLNELYVPLGRAAAGGDRVVIALNLKPGITPKAVKSLDSEWHLKLQSDTDKEHVHRYYFADSPDWRVLDRAGPKVLAVERDLKKGTVAFFAESGDFDNESTLAGDRLRLVLAAIGGNARIVFDEQHLGISAGGSVMEMARRFRLTGLMLGLALVAALFFWRNAAGFPPQSPEPGPGDFLAGRTAQAGLLTLLRRYVPPGELAAACWQEWLSGNRGQVSADRMDRAAGIVRARAGQPLEAAREISLVLRAKGEL